MRFSYLGLSEPVNLVNDALFSCIRSFRHKEPMLQPLNPSGVYTSDFNATAKFASQNEFATYTQVMPFIKNSDIIFCFLPDTALKGLANDLRGHGIKNKIFCHFSPAFNADVLDFGEENTYASFYIPTLKKLPNGSFQPSDVFIEGYGDRYDEIFYVCSILGIKLHEISKKDKLMYISAMTMLTDFQSYIENASKKLLKISLYNDYSLYEDILSKYKNDEYVINNYDPVVTSDIRTINAQKELFDSIGLDDVSTLYASLLLAKSRSMQNDINASEQIKAIALKLIND